MRALLLAVVLAGVLSTTPPVAITDYGKATNVRCSGLRCCATIVAQHGAYTYAQRNFCRMWPVVLKEGAKYRAYMWRQERW